jgi:RNA polymerase sigma factor (sigma-70 family)
MCDAGNARRVGYGCAVDVRELVRLAASNDRAAWESLVTRYESLVWGVTRCHRLSDTDAADVYQTTWLRLVEHVDHLRNPDALSGWLATTARNECLRVLRHQSRQVPTEDDRIPEPAVLSDPDEGLLTAERDKALWQAFAKISARCQALLRVLATDPPPSYDEIGAALGMAVGSIGPTRARCLDSLRRALTSGRITATPPPS